MFFKIVFHKKVSFCAKLFDNFAGGRIVVTVLLRGKESKIL